jgi:hypothetical protein
MPKKDCGRVLQIVSHPRGPEAPHYRYFKLSRLLLRFDHVASFIVNANHNIV